MQRQIGIALLALALAVPAAAMTNEPTGFGAAKFGQSVEEVKKALPKVEPLEGSLGAQAFPSEHLKRFALKGTKVPGLEKPTNVELRFWKDKLWTVIVYFGENPPEQVTAALTKQYGPPAGTPANPAWHGERTETLVVNRERYWATTDNALSTDAQAWFREYLTGQRAEPAAAASPAGTPASATPGGDATPATPAVDATPATPAAN